MNEWEKKMNARKINWYNLKSLSQPILVSFELTFLLVSVLSPPLIDLTVVNNYKSYSCLSVLDTSSFLLLLWHFQYCIYEREHLSCWFSNLSEKAFYFETFTLHKSLMSLFFSSYSNLCKSLWIILRLKNIINYWLI